MNHSRRVVTILGLVVGAATVAHARPDARRVDEFLDSMKGVSLFLKIDVVRVQRVLSGTDATNIDREGQVYYRATLSGLRATHTTSTEEFTEEVRQVAEQEEEALKTRVWTRGTPVWIHKSKAKDDEVLIDLRMTKGSSRIRLKFEDGMPYTVEDVRRLFWLCFAETEAELAGAEETITIQLGMSVDDIINLKGNPITRVNLGSKTMLTYDDMKLIFQEDKLIDVK